jgi:mono/diheme cytochrome c family protein
MKTQEKLLLSLIPALLFSACTGKYIRPTSLTRIEGTPDRIARGQYMVDSVASCGVCHTPRVDANWLGGERGDAYLAGGSVFDMSDEGLKISVPNLTPDIETGLGSWSDDQILRALRDGIHKDKDRLMYPPMPFYMFDQMSDEDAYSVVAYLRSIPPVKNKFTAVREAGFMVRTVMNFGVMHHKPVQNVKVPDRKNAKAYGGYLARMGLCVDCHSLTSMGPDLEDNLLGGGTEPMKMQEIGKIHPRNLTPDKETGLGKFSKAQIVEALRSGKRLDGKTMAAPMSWVIPHLSTWTDEDLDALVTFMQSVPAIKHAVPERELTKEAKKQAGE